MLKKFTSPEYEREFRWNLALVFAESGAVEFRDERLISRFVEHQEQVPLSSLTLDSLSMMELCIALEERWGVEMSPEQASQFKTVSDLALHVLDRIR